MVHMLPYLIINFAFVDRIIFTNFFEKAVRKHTDTCCQSIAYACQTTAVFFGADKHIHRKHYLNKRLFYRRKLFGELVNYLSAF